jgi:hypothetical protein
MEGESVSTKEIFNPKFDDFHGKPVVTWSEAGGAPRVDVNLFEQYRRWRSSKLQRDEPVAAFWQTNGPAIVRALEFCGAKALMFQYVTDRRVAYQWLAGASRVEPSGRLSVSSDWFCVCSVSAEGGTGSYTRVSVVLPTDEEVTFMFQHMQMLHWLKPEVASEVKEMTASEKQDHYRFGEG